MTKSIRELETVMKQLESQLKDIQDRLADENMYKEVAWKKEIRGSLLSYSYLFYKTEGFRVKAGT